MSTDEQKYASFFVRIWQEPRERDEEEPEWRGSVEHVQSGNKRYFKKAEVLVDFVQGSVGDLEPPNDERKYIT